MAQYILWEYYEYEDGFSEGFISNKKIVDIFNTEKEAKERIKEERKKPCASLADYQLAGCKKFTITKKIIK